MYLQVCTHAKMQAQYFLVFLDPLLSTIESDEGDRGIYGIWGHASHYYDVCVNAHNNYTKLVCKGQI